MSISTLGRLNGATRLIIFDEFEIDNDLPKHRKLREALQAQKTGQPKQVQTHMKAARFQGNAEADEPEEDHAVQGGNITFTVAPNVSSTGEAWFLGEKSSAPPQGWKAWLPRFGRKPPKPVPVETVFHLVLSDPQELATFNERSDAFAGAIKSAKAAGQIVLVEQYERERDSRKFENVLYAKGYKKFLTEEQLLRFARNCQKGLCLDWTRYFVRPIPADVVAAKLTADEADLFDNYVVLHFDPEDKATTETDRDRARDPILFGVFKGSRRLYYIKDWTDELCNLTLQQIVDSLGEALEMPSTKKKPLAEEHEKAHPKA